MCSISGMIRSLINQNIHKLVINSLIQLDNRNYYHDSISDKFYFSNLYKNYNYKLFYEYTYI